MPILHAWIGKEKFVEITTQFVGSSLVSFYILDKLINTLFKQDPQVLFIIELQSRNGVPVQVVATIRKKDRNVLDKDTIFRLGEHPDIGQLVDLVLILPIVQKEDD